LKTKRSVASRRFKVLSTLAIGVALFSLLGLNRTAQAANPSTINFQGKVVNSDGTNVTDGSYTFVFRLYDNSSPTIGANCNTNSQCWWEETDSLTVTSGVFQVALGTNCAFTSACLSTHSGIDFNTNSSLFLTMKFNGDASGTNNGFMSPVIQLQTVPYAFNADKLGGLSSSGYIQNTGTQQPTSQFNISGTGVANLFQAPTFDALSSAAALGIGSANAGAITFGNVTNSTILMQIKASSTTAFQIQNGGTNYVAIDTSGNTIALDTAVGSAGHVTIGSTNAHAQNIDIGLVAGGNGANNSTVRIANNTNAGATNSITIGANNSANSVVNIDAGGTGGINIGNTASAHAINIGNASGANNTTINIGNGVTGASNVANVTIGSINAAGSTLTLQGGNGASAISIQAASSGVISIGTTNNNSLTVGGAALFKTSNSTTALQIQNAAGTTLLNVDTSTSPNVLTNGSIEQPIAGNWTGKGSAAASQDATQSYYGTKDLKVITTATNDDGAKQNITLTDSSSYTLSFEALLDGSSTAFATLAAGYNNGTSDTNCTLTSTTIVTGGWTRFICLITTTTHSGTPFIYIKQTNNVIHTFYIDAVQLQQSSSSTAYQEGAITINTAFTSPLAIRTTTNSDSAFMIQNASGNPVFQFDTINDRVGINLNGNPPTSTLDVGGQIKNEGATAAGFIATGTASASATFQSNWSSSNYFGLGAFSASNDNAVRLGIANSDGSWNATQSNFALVDGGSLSIGTNAIASAMLDVGGNLFQSAANPVFKGGGDTLTAGTGSSAIFDSVTVAGHYAYVASNGASGTCSSSSRDGCELQVYDVTNSTSPTYVGGADTLNSGAGATTIFNLAAAGNYLYAVKSNTVGTCSSATRDECQFQIYDVSNPTSPTYVGGADNNTGGNDLSVAVAGKYAYIGRSSSGSTCSPTVRDGCEVQVYDISNPANPAYIGGGDTGTNVLSLAVSGHYLYVGLNSNGGTCTSPGTLTGCEFQVWNIANPAAPTAISGADMLNAGTGSVEGVNTIAISGSYVYLGKKGNAGTCSAGTKDGCEVQIYNVSNPAAPVYTNGVDTINAGNGTDDVKGISIAGRYAYVAKKGNSGTCSLTDRTGCELQTYDISNPASPSYSAGVDSTTGAGADQFNAVYVAGRYAYIAKNADGGTCSSANATGCEFESLDISGADVVSLAAGSLYTGVLQVQDSATFNQNLAIAGGINVGNAAQIGGNLGVAGEALFQTTNNSTQAFRVQNNGGGNIINVDTTGSLASSNQLANPSFESTITGSGAGVWVIKQGGAGTPTISNNTSNTYNQLNSAKVITTANANDGIKQQLSSTLTASTAYNIIFYAKLDPASAAMATLQAGYSSTGASDDQVCSNSATITPTGWTRFVCTITTGGSTSSSNYFFIRQSDAAIHTFYVDAVLLQLSSTADANYRDAKILLNGTITSPVILQNADNSSNAFQVQNASGGQVFSVDTTDSNLIYNPTNPSFEVNTTGWTTVVNGGTVTIVRDTSQQKYGLASLKVTTTAQTAQGARYTLASSNWAAGSYTVSFSMLNSGTAFSAIPIVKFGNGIDNACSAATLESGATGTIPVTTGWTRYAANCTFSGSTTSIAIEQNEATAHTFYIDAVQLETGAVSSIYGLGSISLSGQIVTPVSFKNQSNSTSAFQIQNSSGNNLLAVDTLNTVVNIGITGTQATASTVNISNSSGNVVQTVSIGSNANASSAVNIEAGNTGKIQIGNANSTHTIQIGATAGSAQIVSIGNATASSSLTLQAGSGNASLNVTSGTLTLQTTTSGAINLTPAASSNIVLGTSNTTGELLVLDTDTDTTESTAVAGGMYYNSSLKAFRCSTVTTWTNCGGLTASVTNASAIGTSSTAENAFTTTAATDQTYTLPADFCQAGRVINIHAQGFYGVTSTTAPTLTLRLRLDSNVGTLLGATATVTPTASVTNQSWYFDDSITCKTAGAGGTVDSEGWFVIATTGNTTYNQGFFLAATPPVDITVNTTATHALVPTAQFSLSGASNTATLRQFTVIASGP
jgi:hypothetical protein